MKTGSLNHTSRDTAMGLSDIPLYRVGLAWNHLAMDSVRLQAFINIVIK